MNNERVDYKKQLIAETAAALHSYGYQVYIAKDGRYGFYTDGKSVVCFGGYYLALDFYGCYTAATPEIARQVGTGWGISKDRAVPDRYEADAYINAQPPHWATRGLSVSRTTPEQHLKMYGSSGYTLYQPLEVPA